MPTTLALAPAPAPSGEAPAWLPVPADAMVLYEIWEQGEYLFLVTSDRGDLQHLRPGDVVVTRQWRPTSPGTARTFTP